MAWMIDTQFARRNLNESQRAMLAARKATCVSHRPSAVDKGANLHPSAERAGESMNVSERSVKAAKKVLADGGSALQEAVRDGKVPVSTAAAITELPKDEQNKLASQGKKAVAAKVKEMAKEKPASVAVDQEGREIPADKPKIRVAFARRAEIVHLLSDLSRIKARVLKAHEGKDPIYAELNASDFQMACERARADLRYSAPHAVCPYCSGDGCRACKSKGWVGLAIYAAAPPEMKGKKK